ncbi:MAG: MBL fold metallo-hydrolase [Erysipelotrichaceae bacterium]
MNDIIKLPLGIYQANCYLLIQNQSVLIIDPGAKPERIIQRISDLGCRVVAVVLTHGHFDHIGAVDALVDHYQCPLYLHEADYTMAQDPVKNYSLKNREVSLRTKPCFLGTGMISIAPFELEIFDAPGHSEGSVLIRWKQHLFTGDVIFKESVGRTDLYGSSNSKMKQSIAMVKTMDCNLMLHPGHGESTTLQHELAHNPFF